MPALGNAVFKGRSGRAYRFRVFALGTHFRKRSAVYVIAARSRSEDDVLRRLHEPLYVGQTSDISSPRNGHPDAQSLQEMGANCICVLADDSEESRAAKERDLRAALCPPGNE